MLTYRKIEVRDTRQCPRCGAVAGRCSHLRAQHAILEIPERQNDRDIILQWSKGEEATLERLWLEGRTSYQIAELLNRSRSSIMGKIGAMGLTGLQGQRAA